MGKEPREIRIELVTRTELPGLRVADMPAEVQAELLARLRDAARNAADVMLARLWYGDEGLRRIVEQHERELRQRLRDEFLDNCGWDEGRLRFPHY